MDLRKLKTLIDLVSDSNVSELEITEAEGKVRIVKGGGAVVHSYGTAPVYAPPAAGPGLAAAPVSAPAPAAVEVDTSHAVKSPMVGTFIARHRLAPSPLWKLARWSKKAKPSASLRP